jgi:hypothetical protein
LFSDPAKVAAAVAIVTQRLAFLDDALVFVRTSDPDYAKRIQSMRNSIETDPYGFVAFVLSVEHRCTVESCARFAMLRDPVRVKENMRVRRFEAYMAKYASTWRGVPDSNDDASKAGPSNSPLVTISADPTSAPKPDPEQAAAPAATPAKAEGTADAEPAAAPSVPAELPTAAMAPMITPPTGATFGSDDDEAKAAAAPAPAKSSAPAKPAGTKSASGSAAKAASAPAAKSESAPAAKSASAPEKAAARPPAPAKAKAKDAAAQKSSQPVAGLPRVVPSEYIRDQEERQLAPEQSSTQQPGAPTPITPLQQNFDNR